MAVVTRSAISLRTRGLLESSPIAGSGFTLITIFTLFLFVVPNFATWRTFSGIIESISIAGFAALGATLLMIMGEFDLSIGAMVAMSGYLFGTIATGEDTLIVNTLQKLGLDMRGGNVFLAILLSLLACSLMGLINGLLRAKTRLPSFITTLGSGQIYRGVVWLVSGGALFQTRAILPIFDVLNGRLDSVNNLPIFQGANFRTSTLWLMLVTVILALLLGRTNFGNHVFAVGGNVGAANALVRGGVNKAENE